jgi:hypothetical protein
MKRTIRNSNSLLIKQIKTYFFAFIMTTIAVDALAFNSSNELSPDGVSEIFSESTYEVGIEAELNVESWMTSSFEIPKDEGSATLTFNPTASEMVIESELNMEDWMSKPFEIVVSETPAIESGNCNTAP